MAMISSRRRTMSSLLNIVARHVLQSIASTKEDECPADIAEKQAAEPLPSSFMSPRRHGTAFRTTTRRGAELVAAVWTPPAALASCPYASHNVAWQQQQDRRSHRQCKWKCIAHFDIPIGPRAARAPNV